MLFKKKVGARGLALCAKWEGCERKLADGRYIAYLDKHPSPKYWSPGYNGLWTIGYGSTGPKVTEGTIWTKAQCEKELRRQMNKKAQEINAYLKVKVNQNQFDALCCAAYNLGTAGIHGILDLVNAGKFKEAGAKFMEYKYAGGKVLRGLVRRRAEERELFEWETTKEVAKLSSSVKTSNQVQASTAVGGFSIAALWNYLPQVKDFMQDNAGLVLLGCVGCVLGVTWLWRWHTMKSFNDGTYVPNGTNPVPEEVMDEE